MDLLREKQVSHRIRGTLVVAEIAMAVMLLVGGALLIHSFLQLSNVERGYDATTVLDVSSRAAGSVACRGHGLRRSTRCAIPRNARCHRGWLFEQPAADSAGFSPRDVSPRPLPPGQRAQRRYPSLHAVSPGFVEAMGLRIANRTFTSGELARREALVSRTFVNSDFFDGPALGRQIYGGRGSWEVVGIVEDIRQFQLDSSREGRSSSISSRRRQASAARTSPFALRARRWPLAPRSARSFVRSIRPQRSTTSRRWSRSCRTRCRVRACMR